MKPSTQPSTTGRAAALALLLVAACAPRPAGPSPAAPPAGGTARPVVVAVEPASFEEGLAAARLTKLQLASGSSRREWRPGAAVVLERRMSYAPGGEAVVEGRRVTLFVGAGWNAEDLELARDASGRVFRIQRSPVEHVEETVVDGCQESVFYGGRMWFEQVVVELPEGAAWGGVAPVRYRVERKVMRYSNVTKDGSACPPPIVMID